MLRVGRVQARGPSAAASAPSGTSLLDIGLTTCTKPSIWPRAPTAAAIFAASRWLVATWVMA
jgi:hypothetical protein